MSEQVVAQRVEAAITILSELVGFDTTSRYSNLPLIEWVENFLSAYPVRMERITHPEGHKAALMVTFPAVQETQGVVFSGHTDVVPVDGQEWHTPPFSLTLKGDKLYGRGTSDMKSFIACCLAMASHWAKIPLRKPVHFAFSFDEEIGCKCAAPIGEFIQQQQWNPSLVIVGEPTLMQPVISHKGIRSFVTTVTGREAHSSQTQSGVNAISYAMKLMMKLDQLAQKAQRGVRNPDFTPPYTTLQVGVIQGGTARNIVPKTCRFEWEIRPLPEEDPPALLEEYFAFEAEIQKELQALGDGCKIDTQPASRVTSLKPEKEEALHHLMLGLSESNATECVSYGTEAGILQSYGLPCFICGPGSIAQAHIPNEYIEISQIERCLRFLQRLDGCII